MKLESVSFDQAFKKSIGQAFASLGGSGRAVAAARQLLGAAR